MSVAGYPARGASRARLRSSRRRRPIGRPRATWCQPTIPGPHGPAERGGAGPSSACTGSGAATLCGGGEKAHSERTPEPSGRPARSVRMCGFVRAVSMYDVRPLRNETRRRETAQVHCGDSARRATCRSCCAVSHDIAPSWSCMYLLKDTSDWLSAVWIQVFSVRLNLSTAALPRGQ